MDKSMDKKFRRLYLHEIAFNLIPKQVFCTKANASYHLMHHSAKWNHLCINLIDSSDWDFISM